MPDQTRPDQTRLAQYDTTQHNRLQYKHRCWRVIRGIISYALSQGVLSLLASSWLDHYHFLVVGFVTTQGLQCGAHRRWHRGAAAKVGRPISAMSKGCAWQRGFASATMSCGSPLQSVFGCFQGKTQTDSGTNELRVVRFVDACNSLQHLSVWTQTTHTYAYMRLWIHAHAYRLHKGIHAYMHTCIHACVHAVVGSSMLV